MSQGSTENGNLFLQALGLLQVLAKRKKLILFVCLATALLSAAYSLTLPSIYTATVKVLPPQKEGVGLSSMLGQMGGGIAMLAGGAKGGGDTELYLGILKSRSVGEAVIRRLDLTRVYRVPSERRAWIKLDQAVKAQAGKEGIISISTEDTDPKLSALLANTYADELGRTLVRLNLSKAGSEKLFLEKRLDVVKKDLKAAEEDLRNFSQRNKVVKIEEQAGASVTGVARQKMEIEKKEVELAMLRASQTEGSYAVQTLQAGIQKMKAGLAKAAGRGGTGEGIPSIGNVPEIGLEYGRKLREFKTQEAIFEQLTKQYELAKLNQAKDSSSLQVLDEAVVPDVKSRPRRATLVVMSTLVAFFCSVFLAYALEYLERMPEHEKQVVDDLIKRSLSFK